MGRMSRWNNFRWAGLWQAVWGGGQACTEGVACAERGSWGGRVLGDRQGQGPRHTVLQGTGRAGPTKDKDRLRKALNASWNSHCINPGHQPRVLHDQICVLYKQGLSRRQFGNLSSPDIHVFQLSNY